MEGGARKVPVCCNCYTVGRTDITVGLADICHPKTPTVQRPAKLSVSSCSLRDNSIACRLSGANCKAYGSVPVQQCPAVSQLGQQDVSRSVCLARDTERRIYFTWNVISQLYSVRFHLREWREERRRSLLILLSLIVFKLKKKIFKHILPLSVVKQILSEEKMQDPVCSS